MAKRTTAKTPPKERKRIDGDGCFTIVTVDREQNMVSLDVEGYPVTLTCRPEKQLKTVSAGEGNPGGCGGGNCSIAFGGVT